MSDLLETTITFKVSVTSVSVSFASNGSLLSVGPSSSVTDKSSGIIDDSSLIPFTMMNNVAEIVSTLPSEIKYS